MNNLLDLTSPHGKVSIPVSKIVGICEPGPASKKAGFNTFIATGPDDEHGNENGWYVLEEYFVVRAALDSIITGNCVADGIANNRAHAQL